MFKKIISDTLITKYLGDYIEGLNSNQVKIQLWQGNVILENLQLKKDTLNKRLDLEEIPLIIKKNFIGRLELKIPWNNVKNEPIIIIIEDVFLWLCPKKKINLNNNDDNQNNNNNDNEIISEEYREKWKKQQKLSNLNDSSLQMNSNISFLNALFTKIVDNLQFRISNVHIRFDDDDNSIYKNVNQSFSFGIILEYLEAQSVDENWNPTFITQEHKLIYKVKKYFFIYFIFIIIFS